MEIIKNDKAPKRGAGGITVRFGRRSCDLRIYAATSANYVLPCPRSTLLKGQRQTQAVSSGANTKAGVQFLFRTAEENCLVDATALWARGSA